MGLCEIGRPRRILVWVALVALSYVAKAQSRSGEIHPIVVDAASSDFLIDGNCEFGEALTAANAGIHYDACVGPPEGAAIEIQLAVDEPIELAGPQSINVDLAIAGVGLGARVLDCTATPSEVCLIVRTDVALTLREVSLLAAGNREMLSFDGGNVLVIERSQLVGGRPVVISQGSTAVVVETLLAGFEHRPSLARGSNELLGGALIVEGSVELRDSTLANSLVLEPDDVRAGKGRNVYGGAIACDGGALDITRSTVSGNRAEGETASAGALFLRDCDAVIRHSTIVDNEAESRAAASLVAAPVGGIRVEGTTALSIENSIVGGNRGLTPGSSAPLDLAIDFSAVVTSLGANFVSSNQGAAAEFPDGEPNANGDFVGTVVAPLELDLGPLADNGGPTRTHLPAVSADSWIVDHGICPGEFRDQRGFGDQAGRAVDEAVVTSPWQCDIGAVEVGAPAPTLFADGFETGDTTGWSSSTP